MEFGYLKIIECCTMTGVGLLAVVQHNENGIPTNSQLLHPDRIQKWIVKKRVFHGILILDNSEVYFDCETESIHVDSVFENDEKRQVAVKKELDKRKQGIYMYIIASLNKKQQIKLDKDTLLKILSPN